MTTEIENTQSLMDDHLPKEIKESKEQCWECNECGSQEYTMSVSEPDVQRLNCSHCGGDEWHKADVRPGVLNYLRNRTICANNHSESLTMTTEIENTQHNLTEKVAHLYHFYATSNKSGSTFSGCVSTNLPLSSVDAYNALIDNLAQQFNLKDRTEITVRSLSRLNPDGK